MISSLLSCSASEDLDFAEVIECADLADLVDLAVMVLGGLGVVSSSFSAFSSEATSHAATLLSDSDPFVRVDLADALLADLSSESSWCSDSVSLAVYNREGAEVFDFAEQPADIADFADKELAALPEVIQHSDTSSMTSQACEWAGPSSGCSRSSS